MDPAGSDDMTFGMDPAGHQGWLLSQPPAPTDVSWLATRWWRQLLEVDLHEDFFV
jgi:hypothetical protein